MLSPEIRAAHKYLFSAEEETRILKEKNTSKDYLKTKIRELGEPDENGNILWYFDEPLTLPSGTYNGLMLQRRVSEYTDEEIAREIIWDSGLMSRCMPVIEVRELDLDEIYACNQEGLLSDEQIDSMIVVNESFALVKIKE